VFVRGSSQECSPARHPYSDARLAPIWLHYTAKRREHQLAREAPWYEQRTSLQVQTSHLISRRCPARTAPLHVLEADADPLPTCQCCCAGHLWRPLTRSRRSARQYESEHPIVTLHRRGRSQRLHRLRSPATHLRCRRRHPQQHRPACRVTRPVRRHLTESRCFSLLAIGSRSDSCNGRPRAWNV